MLGDEEARGLVDELEAAFRDLQRAPPASEADTASTADMEELQRRRRLHLRIPSPLRELAHRYRPNTRLLADVPAFSEGAAVSDLPGDQLVSTEEIKELSPQPPCKRQAPPGTGASYEPDMAETAHDVYKLVQRTRVTTDSDAAAGDDGWRELAASCMPGLVQLLGAESAERSVLWVGAGDLAELASLAMGGARMWVRAVEINAAAVRTGHRILSALGSSGDERSRTRRLFGVEVQYEVMDGMQLRKARGYDCIYCTAPVPALGAHLRRLAWTAGARLCLLSRVFTSVGAPVRDVQRFEAKLGGSGEKVVLVCGLVHHASEK